MPFGVGMIRNWRPSLLNSEYELANREVDEEESALESHLEKAEVERVGLWGLWWMVFCLVSSEAFCCIMSREIPTDRQIASRCPLHQKASDICSFYRLYGSV